MDTNKDNRQQGGSGSAEQTNRDRNEQKLQGSASEGGKADIASQIGEKQSDVKTISDLGGMSGRDDASGGSGDRMENESSNEQTDKP